MLKLLRLPLFRSMRVENSRNPGRRPALMLISLMLFVVSRSRRRDHPNKSAHSAVRTAFQPQRRRTARPRPERATGER
uniref:Uncharacterized protein n=2 Tax=Rhizobium rhizogenes TaxID=359 RepID=A0A2Z2PQ15_RHIRH|nr:hypothetical protein [Rhizobium rhizogenes]